MISEKNKQTVKEFIEKEITKYMDEHTFAGKLKLKEQKILDKQSKCKHKWKIDDDILFHMTCVKCDCPSSRFLK